MTKRHLIQFDAIDNDDPDFAYPFALIVEAPDMDSAFSKLESYCQENKVRVAPGADISRTDLDSIPVI